MVTGTVLKPAGPRTVGSRAGRRRDSCRCRRKGRDRRAGLGLKAPPGRSHQALQDTAPRSSHLWGAGLPGAAWLAFASPGSSTGPGKGHDGLKEETNEDLEVTGGSQTPILPLHPHYLQWRTGSWPHLSPRSQASTSRGHHQLAQPRAEQARNAAAFQLQRTQACRSERSAAAAGGAGGGAFAAVYMMWIWWINKLHFPGLPISKHAEVYIRSET